MAHEDNFSEDVAYQVVINDEEQYSIWMADRPLPDGWRSSGFRGLKAECLDHIEQVWTDMRPRSLREAMQRLEKQGQLPGIKGERGGRR